MIQELFSIAGKTAVITGGSRGIGYMIAHGYVAAGARVYISSRKKAQCDAAAAELCKLGTCISLPADLGRMEEIERVAAELDAREDKLDILVNNAGATWGASLDEYPEAGWDKVMDLNVKSPFFLLQKLLPALERAASATEPSRVINVGSVDGMHTSIFENFAYGPSKAALHHMTRMLATHLAARHVNVNCIAPGPFDTEMTRPMLAKIGLEAIVHNVPMKRMGNGQDAAGVAIFLAARASAFVNGTVLAVDGGLFGAS